MRPTPNSTPSLFCRPFCGPRRLVRARSGRVTLGGVALATLAVVANASAAPHGPPTGADFAKLQDDLAHVQQELRDQRQLILQLM